MRWHLAKHKETGEEEIVLVPVGGGESYGPDTHTLMALPRKPDEFDDIVDGKLVRNHERKARHGSDPGVANWGPEDLVRYFEDRLAGRIPSAIRGR